MISAGGTRGFGVLGKLPARDDFVHAGTADESFLELDAWLAKNVEWALARRSEAWPAAFAAGGLRAFVFRASGGGRVLAGTMAPSSDRAGRQFPVVVAAPVVLDAASIGTPHGLPLVLEPWWQLAGQLAQQLSAGADLDLLEQVALPALETASALAEALADYDAWVADLPVNELWALVYGSRDGQPTVALRLLLEAVRFCRGVERPDTPLSLRLPLGSAAGAAVCFWIDLTRRLLRWQATVPSFFWSHDGTSGEMLLHLGAPAPSTLAELWLPSRDRDEVCDLGSPLSDAASAALPPLPDAFSTLLEQRGTVRQLLQAAALG